MVYTSPWFHCLRASFAACVLFALDRPAIAWPDSQASFPDGSFISKISASAPA